MLRLFFMAAPFLANRVSPTRGAATSNFNYARDIASSSVELDKDAALIAYEEYHPYGTTSFQAGRSAAEVGLKRYRYTGMERDEETGFGNHTARRYVPWLGRWLTPDPIGLEDSNNLYQYVSANPIRLVDPLGLSGWDRFWGGVKAVGGVVEVAAGGALIAAGAATSEIGVGIPIAAAGVRVKLTVLRRDQALTIDRRSAGLASQDGPEHPTATASLGRTATAGALAGVDAAECFARSQSDRSQSRLFRHVEKAMQVRGDDLPVGV